MCGEGGWLVVGRLYWILYFFLQRAQWPERKEKSARGREGGRKREMGQLMCTATRCRGRPENVSDFTFAKKSLDPLVLDFKNSLLPQIPSIKVKEGISCWAINKVQRCRLRAGSPKSLNFDFPISADLNFYTCCRQKI